MLELSQTPSISQAAAAVAWLKRLLAAPKQRAWTDSIQSPLFSPWTLDAAALAACLLLPLAGKVSRTRIYNRFVGRPG